MKKKTTTELKTFVMIDENLKKKVFTILTSQGLSFKTLIHHLLTDYVKDHENEVKEMFKGKK